MTEKHALVEHSSAINTIIRNTFQTTHRIKFTSFDVSSKYIIFGANSGGIYIFTREPCQFLKLIPSTHGPTTLLQISPNQENLAIAVSTGLVIVLEGCFSPHFESQVFTEHEGNTVTALVWNGDDLYCGDSTGRVSVVTLKNFMTMFQTPVASLMHLDSQIVQLDAHSKFLLVSTQTKSVLCDTETERYRQIGKKMRDGFFGACFLNSSPHVDFVQPSRAWGPFKTLSENEQLAFFATDDVKIYCARPGARLWQADFQANVVVTHQFRSSLCQQQHVILWDDCDELKVRESEGPGVNFNFSKIFGLGKFIVTFRDDGVYVFEPSESAFVHCCRFSNIKDMKIVDSFLYVWHDGLVSVLSLMSVEDLVIWSLVRKKYNLCGELCIRFYDDILSLLETSKKIHLVSALEDKIGPEMRDKLMVIFQKLKDYAKKPEKLNGIVVVNAFPVLPESVQNFESEKDTEISTLTEQFKVHKLQKKAETSDFIKLVENISTDAFFQLINKFEAETPDCGSWCKEVFLKHMKPEDLPQNILNYATIAFLEINTREDLVCKCNFPLPQAHMITPKYSEIGCFLMEKTTDSFVNKVPSMQKFVLKKLAEIQTKIPLIIQFSDPETIKLHSDKITFDLWDESIQLLLKLKSGQCLNCGSHIDPTASLEWTDFGLLMVESIKPINAVKLLKHYAKVIPKGELDHFFYQYCIFSSVVTTKSLMEMLAHPNVQQEFDDSVGGFLRQKYLRGGDYYEPPSHKMGNCDHCQLPLKIPVLEKNKKMSCGHNFHVACFLRNDERCSVCKPF